MNLKILSVFFAIATSSFANVSKDAIQKVTLNNCKVAVEEFASNLVKRKLDNNGYGALREKIGILQKGQELEAFLITPLQFLRP